MTEFKWFLSLTFLEVVNAGCALNNLLCYYTEKYISTKVRGRRYDSVLSEAAVHRCFSK